MFIFAKIIYKIFFFIHQDVDVVLSSKYGQLYRCSFSSALEAEKNRRQQENDNLEETLSVTDLLKPLETLPCLIYVCICLY